MTECENCAHLIEKTDTEPGHKDVEGTLICLKCGEVCRKTPVPAATPPTATPMVTSAPTPPQNVEALAREVAQKVTSLRNEMIWKDLQRPGVIVRSVDGGWIIENRWGEESVRVDFESMIQRVREWLSPPK